MVWGVAAIVVVSLMVVMIIWEHMWLKPQRIRSFLKKQGIKGPKPSFPLGNLLEIKRIQSQFSNNLSSLPQPEQWFPSFFPFLQHWRKVYSSMFVFSTGHRQHVYVGDPKVIKELNRAKPMDLGRPTYVFKPLKPLLGSGILTVNGPPWSFQRNLIAPEFSLFKIQNMVDYMEESTKETVRKWERIIAESGKGKVAEIVIDDDMKDLTANMISKACFGGSYAQGNQIFAKLTALQALVAKPNMLFGFLYLRILPTKENREVWRLEKEIEELVLNIVHNRELQNKNSGTKDYENHHNEKDLLQIIIDNIGEANNKKKKQRVIVDICKNIYFAGSETTAVLLTWTLVLLCFHPHWQHRLRAEILQTYPNMNQLHCLRDMDKLRNMRQVTMVIQESLRLYGPGITTAREALKDVKVGEMEVPKGTNILVFITAIHRDPEIWGEDANEFKPERFEGGVSKACKYPQAYLPFGMGSHVCVGQHFAILEAKIALILLLSNFSFSLSPNYRHSPFYKMSLTPQYGVPLLVTKL